MFRFALTSITFSDGTTVPLPSSGVVLVVGPNNAGKSKALVDINSHLLRLPNKPHDGLVLTDIQLERGDDFEELLGWLNDNSHVSIDHSGRTTFSRGGHSISDRDADIQWSLPDGAMPRLMPMFLHFANAEGRLSQTLEGEIPPPNSAPGSAIQAMYQNPDLEARVSNVAFEAFGQRLTLSKIPGTPLELKVGSTVEKPKIPADSTYVAAVEAMPLVRDQGDGFRSFVGLMLAVATAAYPIIVIDEPEAFLHPPQARLLGRKLASETSNGTQVFVATHDSDILHGALESKDAEITIIRLDRRVSSGTNNASVLEAENLRALWKDPILRYSNVLQGLFHKGVVVSEGDSDSKFYAAVLDADLDNSNQPPHDLLFTQAGGKHRIPTVVRALTAIGVPTSVIVDIDILNDSSLLKNLVTLLNGNWNDISRQFTILKAAIDDMGQSPTAGNVRDRMVEILPTDQTTMLSREQSKAIGEATAVKSGWKHIKRGGVSMIPTGGPRKAADELLARLGSLGIFVVPVGELEHWVPQVNGASGPNWVASVLEADLHLSAVDAAKFMREVHSSLHQTPPHSR